MKWVPVCGQYFQIYFCKMKRWEVWLKLHSLIFVLRGPISNMPALIKIMAWCQSGNMPLSEPMMASLADACTCTYCRIWLWSPMPCEKHGPRDSVDKNRGQRPRFLSLLRPEGHVFHTAWETMIKSYYSTLADWFFLCFIHMNMNFSALKWAIFGSLHGC